jgi:hypothetical protein
MFGQQQYPNSLIEGNQMRTQHTLSVPTINLSPITKLFHAKLLKTVLVAPLSLTILMQLKHPIHDLPQLQILNS